MGGVVLGSHNTFRAPVEGSHDDLHQLKTLELLALLCILLWRTDVPPKALYSCEVRDLGGERLASLCCKEQDAVATQHVEGTRGAAGAPFGHSAIRDPVLEMREQQLQWLKLVCNSPGLVEVHRTVAWTGGEWTEPSAALRVTLKAVGGTEGCVRTVHWLVVDLGAGGDAAPG